MTPWRDRARDERGSVTVWVIVVIGGILGLFAGLAYDGGNAVNTRAEIADAAWALARTAAAQTVTSPSGNIVINESDAMAAVAEVAEVRWPELQWVLAVNGDRAMVRVTGTYETKILHIVGVTEWEFESDRTAIVETG